ncbi:MAG: WD40 repeat domain-containing protein [Armatimonadetes bacterium]|nr:WD40 repeat domain-containing protein [Armatimonadota bacterium]
MHHRRLVARSRPAAIICRAGLVLLLLAAAVVRGCSPAAAAPELVLQTGHSRAIGYQIFSPDGALLATAGEDGLVKLWRAETGEVLHTFTDTLRVSRYGPGFQSAGIAACAFSPDGSAFATAHRDGVARVWDRHTGALRYVARPPEEPLWGIAFADRGRLLVTTSGTDDWMVRLWDAATGTPTRALPAAYTAGVARGGGVIVAGLDGRVAFWDAATGARVGEVKVPDLLGRRWALSPDGTLMAAERLLRRDLGTIGVWDTRSGAHLRTLSGHDVGLTALRFSPDGTLLASACALKVRLWNPRTGESLQTLPGGAHIGQGDLAFSPDGRLLAAAGTNLWRSVVGQQPPLHLSRSAILYASPTGEEQPQTFLYDTRTGEERRQLRDARGPLAFSADGRLLAACGPPSQRPLVLDIPTGKALRATEENVSDTRCLAWAPDGRSLSTNSVLWSLETGSAMPLKPPSSGKDSYLLALGGPPIYEPWGDGPLRYTPDGRLVVRAFQIPGMINRAGAGVWSAATGEHLRTLSTVNWAVLSPDATLLALSAAGGGSEVRDLRSGERRCHLPGAQVMCFSTDGRLLAAREERDLALYRTGDGKRLRTLKSAGRVQGPRAGGREMLFTPDGRLLTYGAALWNTATGERRALEFGGQEGWFILAAFSPDGRLLARGGGFTAPGSPTVVLWDTRTRKVVRRLESRLSPRARRVVFSPDGATVAADVEPGAIQLWDVKSGMLRATIADGGPFAFSGDGKLLVTAGAEALSFHRIPEGKLILKLSFLPGGQWLAVTPDGHYDHSEGAERFIRWRAGDRLLPASAHEKTYRRPGVDRLPPPADQ